MKKLSFPILIAFIFAIGCNSGGGTSSEPATEQPAEQVAPPPPQDPAGFQNPPHGQPGHVHNEGVPDTGMVVPQGDVKLNPPHGEPGHRCDIAVGAPLPTN